MMKNRIAVISADEELASFFVWEARACGCPVELFSEPPTTLVGFDLAVLDLRAGPCLPDHGGCRLAVITWEGMAEIPMADVVWEWPISVLTVRQTYESSSLEESLPTKRREWETVAIYLLSEGERRVLYRNRTISLTDREWRILRTLGDAEGQLVSLGALAERLGASDGNAVKVHLCHLRKKLEEPFGIRALETARGRGYRLTVPLKEWK